VILMSLNAFASTPYLCLLAEGAPEASRTKAFAFLNVCNILPGALLPWVAASLANSHDFLPMLRLLFLSQAILMAGGIVWRGRILRDLAPGFPTSSPSSSMWETFKALCKSTPFRKIWPILLLQGAFQGVWGAWSAIYLTESLRLPDFVPGWNAQISAVTLILTILLVLPRIREHQVPMAAAISFGLSFLAGLGWLAPLSTSGVLALGAVQGFAAGITSAAVASLLATSLPIQSRDHGYALAFLGVHLSVAGIMGFAGHFLQVSPQRFPALVITLLGVQSIVGIGLLSNGSANPTVEGP